MQKTLLLSLLVIITLAGAAQANQLDFTVTALGAGGPEVLVIGGIQGDEPGGFSAAALLATRYNITRGTVRVVPNLNFISIIERSRGTNSDMNRKFASISPNDPDYDTVCRIQSIITAPSVDLILHLHDGSGFYRPTQESNLRNPNRWGQCVIIDLERWPNIAFGELKEMADMVAADVNQRLLKPDHTFFVKNTHTDKGNLEMAKTLTWYALNRDKAAFGLEVSKEFGVSERAYYHLCMVESFLKRAGVEFSRNFELSPTGVAAALGSNIYVGFMNNRLVLPLEGARRQQAGSLPLQRGETVVIDANMPIVAVTGDASIMKVHYGNNVVTSFKPDWMDTDYSLTTVTVMVDGVAREVDFGSTIYIDKNFLVEPIPGHRANAIGVPLAPDESGILLTRAHFKDNYSVDQAGTIFRVEIYRDKIYCGTFLVSFGPERLTAAPTPLLAQPGLSPDAGGPESELGR